MRIHKNLLRTLISILGVATWLVLSGCMPPLIRAASEGDTKAVQALLDQGADPNMKFQGGGALSGPDSPIALHYAAREGHEDVVRLLLDKGADINAGQKREALCCGIFFATPLNLAITGGVHPTLLWGWQPESGPHLGVIKLLLARGVVVDDFSLGWAKKMNLPLVTQLLEQAAARQHGTEQSPASTSEIRQQAKPVDVDRLIADAQTAQREGNYQAAILAMRRAVRGDTKSAPAYRQTAELLLRLCDADGAKRVVEVGLKQISNDQQLRQLLGRVTSQKDQPPNEADPTVCRVQALNREGLGLAKGQRTVDALTKFEEAARLTGSVVPKVHYNAALILEQMGKPEEALRHFVAAQQSFLLPDDEMEVLTRLVALAQRQGITVPDSADRRYRVGILRAQQKRYQEAVQEFEAALTEAPWLVDAYYNLGLVYDFTGAYGDALRAFKTYLQLSPAASNVGTVKTKIIELEERLGSVSSPTK